MSGTTPTVAFFNRYARHYSRAYTRRSYNVYEDWYARRRLRTVLGQLDRLDNPDSLVDLGCGSGDLTVSAMRHVGGPATVAVDLAAGMLQVLGDRQVPGLRLVQADVTDTNLPSGGFDLALSIGVLPYLDEPAEGIAEVARVLAPAGHAVITYPIKNSPMRFFRDTAPGRFIKNRVFKSGLYRVGLSRRDFFDVLRRHGLAVRQHDSLWPSEFCVTVQKGGAGCEHGRL